MTNTEIVTGLVDHFTSPDGVDNPTAEDRRRAALVNLGLWLARREALQFSFNVTVTIVGGLVGAATLFLLYEQNQRITLQTDANVTESVLLEGTRRAALAADMANLFEALRAAPHIEGPACEAPPFADCWERDTEQGITRFHLPVDLQARVTSFALRNTPYRIAVSRESELDFDDRLRRQFTFPNLSPERGQLLETLALNDISVGLFNFENAQLTNVNLSKRDLSMAQMREADLQRAFLRWTRLDGVDLSGGTLRDADLAGATFSGAVLTGADLRQTDLTAARLAGAQMQGARLDGANISGAEFRAATLADTTFNDTWAWIDNPPVNLPLGIRIVFCDYAAASVFRWQRQPDC